MKNLRKGFTLVGIMIVVLIIGVLMAIAIPNFLNARTTAQTKACIANLKQIQSATEQVLMKNQTPSLSSTEKGGLWATDGPMKAEPVCPAAGTYTMAETSPYATTCGVEGHVLP